MRGDNDGAIVERILAGVSRSPRDVVPSVPEPLSAVCMRALRFEREERFPTASAFAEALEAAALESGIAIATPRAVSALLKDLHIESSMASVRAVSGEMKTLTAPFADLPTVRERITPPSGARPLALLKDARDAHDAHDDRTRVTFAGRLRERRKGLLVSAGLVALALTGWFLISGLGDGAAADKAPVAVVTTSTPSLEPPSVVAAPDGDPGDVAVNQTTSRRTPSSASKEVEPAKSSRRSDAAPSGGRRVPPPSATAFRPREL
jgi:hypothetical protein